MKSRARFVFPLFAHALAAHKMRIWQINQISMCLWTIGRKMKAKVWKGTVNQGTLATSSEWDSWIEFKMKEVIELGFLSWRKIFPLFFSCSIWRINCFLLTWPLCKGTALTWKDSGWKTFSGYWCLLLFFWAGRNILQSYCTFKSWPCSISPGTWKVTSWISLISLSSIRQHSEILLNMNSES